MDSVNLSYDYYKIFYYAAKYKSLSRAAAALMCGQPNVTKAIGSLEAQLGCQLFLRTGRGVTLTPEGERLYAHVSVAYEHITQGEAEILSARALETGTVTIGTTETALYGLLIPVLEPFHKAHPRVKLRIFSYSTHQAIQALKSAGVYKTVMLTGDAGQVAHQVAAELGVDQVYSQLLPADKVEKVEELLARKRGKEKLAFVGDGINDAPVLGRADIGIAMGAMGSDAAIEAADVVLMDDDPMQIAKAIKISRKCLGIVYQNIVVAIGVKLLCLVLVALGFANMWLAVFDNTGDLAGSISKTSTKFITHIKIEHTLF